MPTVTLLTNETFVIRLGPGAQSTMLPKSATLVSGEPDNVKLKIKGTVAIDSFCFKIDTENEVPHRINQNLVRAILREDGSSVWQNPDPA